MQYVLKDCYIKMCAVFTVKDCYIKAEQPIVILKPNKELGLQII